MSRRGTDLPPERIAQARAQRSRELHSIIARLNAEREAAEARLAQTDDVADRAAIETEIMHLALALSQLRGGHYPDS